MRERELKERGEVNQGDRKKKNCVVIPYCQGMSERLKRVYKKYDVNMFSKPGFKTSSSCPEVGRPTHCPKVKNVG